MIIGNVQIVKRAIKMKVSTILYLFFFSLILTSCDPLKTVLVTNHSDMDVTVKILQDSTSELLLGPQALTEFELTQSEGGSSTRFNYGLGVFSREEVKVFNSTIKQIDIISESGGCTIVGDDLSKYLPKRRLGMYNNVIEIKIKKCPK
mgnify:CR=1 FL=1